MTFAKPFGIGKLFLLSVLAAVCAAAAAGDTGYRLVRAPKPHEAMQVFIYRLDNGLEVHITENREAPRFYAELAVRAGSKNDPPETTGLAHYFEHLMFKGSERLGTLGYEKEKPLLDRIEELYEIHFRESDPEKRREIYAEIDRLAQEAAQYVVPNELDRLYSAMGGVGLNAHTWLEETVYKVDLPANRLRQWALIEADRFAAPVFRLFPTELETVYEEKNRSMDNKDRIMYEAVNQLLFKKHPYGQQTVLGDPEHLKSPSIRNITRFFEQWYVPENMAIFISGDIRPDEAIAVIAEHFNALPRRSPPKQKKWNDPKPKGREFVEVSFEAEEFVLLAFRTVKRSHKDAEALQMLDMILDNATAGLINLNLNQRQRVRHAGATQMQLNDDGVQYLYGIPKDGQTLEEVEQLLLEQLEIIKRGEIEDWLIPAIINDFKKNEKAALESNVSRVSMMCRAWLGYQRWDDALGYIARMERITKKDVVRVARKYFQGDYVAGFRRDAPHSPMVVEKPPITPVEIDPTRQSAFAAEVLAKPVEPIEPVFVDPEKDFQMVEDENGVTVYHAPNPINDIFTFSITVEFGSHQDSMIAPAVQLLEKSGTERFSAEDLKREWYKLGTDFGIRAGNNQTTITLSGLDENFEASLALLMEVLRTPAAPPETLEELKRIILVQRADAKKQAESISSALIQFNRYGEDSYFLRMLPDAAILELTVDQLHGLTRRLLDYKHTVSYTGSLPMDRVLALLREYDPVEAPLADPPSYRYLKARRPEQTEVYLFDKEMAQSHIRIEFGGVEYDEALVPAIELFNDYFGVGMAAVVFQELREARGLAYVAGARYLTGYRAGDENLMIGVIQTQTDKTLEAANAFIALLDRMPVSPERFAAAREAIINQYRTGKIGFRDILDAVQAWKRLGIPIDPRARRYAAVTNSDLATLVGFFEEHIAGRPKLISLVGEKARIDLDALAQIGPVREVGLDDIFVK